MVEDRKGNNLPEGIKSPEINDKKIEIVAFDLDGTLIDNIKKFKIHFVVVAHRIFVDSQGMPLISRTQAALHFNQNPDLPSRKHIADLAIKLGWDPNSQIVKDAGEELYEKCSKQTGKVLPFAENTLRDLKEMGVRVIICTGSREADAKEKIFGTGLSKYFPEAHIIGSDSTPDGKTILITQRVEKGEQQFRIAARRLGFLQDDYEKFKKSLIFVTDTRNDILVAKLNGVKTYGVSEDPETRTWMLNMNADFVRNNLSGFSAFVERNRLMLDLKSTK